MDYKNINDIKDAKSVLSPPGDTLKSIIDQRSLSQVDLAKRMNKHKKTINEIINGHAPIAPETALELERTLNVPAKFWLERERRYQLQLAELNEAEKLIREKEWTESFPLFEMKKYGFIEYDRDPISKSKSLLQFFGVSSKEAYEQFYGVKYSMYLAPRISAKHDINPNSVTAWLRRGEIQARKVVADEFDIKTIKKCLPDLKEIMVRQKDNFFDELKSICSACGIRVVHTPKLPKAPLSGSTRWYRDKPLIQLSNRYKRNDIFWFTFFHELGHIILHGKKDVFIEGFEYTEKGKIKEQEADDFAVTWTLSKDQESEIFSNVELNTEMVKEYACKFNTHPAIIMGRIAHKAPLDQKPTYYQIGFSEGLFKKVSFE